MKRKRSCMISAMVWLVLGVGGLLRAQTPLGTAFTYQGRLTDAGVAKDGTCDFHFALFNALTGGTQEGSTVTKTSVAVSDGLFTVQLDFGVGVFAGSARWLETEVMCPPDPGFTLLSPRQELTPASQAIYASQAGDADTLDGLDSSDLGDNPTNELNSALALNGSNLELTDAGGTLTADLSALIDDADADPTNELNSSLALNGSNLELTDAGGTLTADLSSLGGGGAQQTSFTDVGYYETRSVTGTTVIGVYRSTAVDIGGTDYYRIPYLSGHQFDEDTVKATEYYSSQPPWHGVDPLISGIWGTDTATANVKFNFDLGTARVVNGLVLVNASGNSGVNLFRIYGTNAATAFNNTDYLTMTDLTWLHTDNAASTTDGSPQYFTFANSTAYRYIVLRIESNHGGTVYLGIQHVQMMWTDSTDVAWELMQPGVDYSVARTNETGSQSLTIRMHTEGTNDIVVDHQ